ncbi:MAG TPA: response regulator [Terracidiphilus sp.]|jgi:DNA-binding response OmpR family regulator
MLNLPDEAVDLGERRILVVEDEQVIADTLGQILSAHGYAVRIAYSAEEAIIIISGWQPHIALLDVMLPNMNGIDFAVLLKRDHPRCGVLLFSGQPSVEQLLQKAREEGHSFEILAKPIHPTVVLNTISGLLSAGDPEPCPQS